MKRLMLFILLLYLSTSLLTSPVTGGLRGDHLDTWMLEKYPDWWEWTDKDRTATRNMFEGSRDKHAWFPDKYNPPNMSFTITPSSWKKKLIR